MTKTVAVRAPVPVGVNVTFTWHADLGSSLEQVVFTAKSDALVPLTCAEETVIGTFVEMLLRVDACGVLLMRRSGWGTSGGSWTGRECFVTARHCRTRRDPAYRHR